MKTTEVYTATEARENLFEILNQVYYGGKEVFITKNNKVMVKIVKESFYKPAKKDIMMFKDTISESDAKIIKDAVEENKKLPARAYEEVSP